MSVALHGVSKAYETHPRHGAEGRVDALRGIDLAVEEKELLVVVGPSGSGKTTLLRSVAGLEPIDAGRIEVGGRDVTRAPPGDRDVAMVFQEYALYPHLTVEGNVSFGLRARRVSAEQTAARVRAAADALGLSEVFDRRPAELSGGERQRVALARAIVREPKAFLLDEPLSNLDAELRTRTRAEIKALQRRLETTTLYVTHDQVEAMTMGDRVAVLRSGRLEQVDDPVTLYERPANGFVARFLGSPPMNLVPPAVLGEEPGRAPVVGIRPERMRIRSAEQARVRGTVELVEPIGNGSIVHVRIKDHHVLVRTDWRDGAVNGGEVGIDFSDADLLGFESRDGPVVG